MIDDTQPKPIANEGNEEETHPLGEDGEIT